MLFFIFMLLIFYIFFAVFMLKQTIFMLYLHLIFLNYVYDCLQVLRVPRKHPISFKLRIIQYLSCSVL